MKKSFQMPELRVIDANTIATDTVIDVSAQGSQFQAPGRAGAATAPIAPQGGVKFE